MPPLALIAALALAQAPAPAAPPAQPANPSSAPRQIWLIGDKDIAFTPAPVVFPLNAGILTATEHVEASHQGENIDNAVQYHSRDGAIFGTAYVYYPGLAHAGLAALAEDWAIRTNSPKISGGTFGIGAAGGVDRVALTTEYENYRGELASTAAFLKAGRWLVAFRVSGPAARKAEVEAAMQALLQGVRFGRAAPVHAAQPMTISDCRARGEDAAAKPLPDPTGAAIAAYGFLGTFDGGGIEATQDGARRDLPSRVPNELCRDSLRTRNGPVLLLRAADGEALSIDGRSVRLVLLSDSGRILEVDHAPNLGGYVLLYHDLGETDVLGAYDSIPSDRQLADILDGTDSEGARIRVPVHFHAGRGPDVILPGGPDGK